METEWKGAKLLPPRPAPTLIEIEQAEEFLYPKHRGLYSHEQRKKINALARDLMHRRLTSNTSIQ